MEDNEKTTPEGSLSTEVKAGIGVVVLILLCLVGYWAIYGFGGNSDDEKDDEKEETTAADNKKDDASATKKKDDPYHFYYIGSSFMNNKIALGTVGAALGIIRVVWWCNRDGQNSYFKNFVATENIGRTVWADRLIALLAFGVACLAVANNAYFGWIGYDKKK